MFKNELVHLLVSWWQSALQNQYWIIFELKFLLFSFSKVNRNKIERVNHKEKIDKFE